MWSFHIGVYATPLLCKKRKNIRFPNVFPRIFSYIAPPRWDVSHIVNHICNVLSPLG